MDPINEALVQLLTDVISFHEAIDSSVLITFFEVSFFFLKYKFNLMLYSLFV